MIKQADIDKADWKFFKEKPEDGFSYERNQAIIDGTIKKYEAMRRKKYQQFREGLLERTDAIAQFLTSPKFTSTSAGKYFGKRWMAYLRGDTIRQKLMNPLQADTTRLYKQVINEQKTT